MPDNAPPDLKLAGTMVGEIFARGFMCYGIPIGTNEYVTHQLQEKAVEIVDDAVKTVEVLAGDKQALWTVLRMSPLHRFKYFCQLAPPSLTEPVAAWLDERL